MNRTVKERLSKLQDDKKMEWDELVDDVMFSVNSQSQKSTRYAPFFLMYIRKPNNIMEVSIYDIFNKIAILCSKQ